MWGSWENNFPQQWPYCHMPPSQALKMADWGYLLICSRGRCGKLLLMSESGGGSLMTPAWAGVSKGELAHAASREGKPLIDHVTGTREHDICPPFTSGGSDLPPLTHPHKQLLWVWVILTNFFDRETGNDDLCEWEVFWCMQNICGNSEAALMSWDVQHDSTYLGIEHTFS